MEKLGVDLLLIGELHLNKLNGTEVGLEVEKSWRVCCCVVHVDVSESSGTDRGDVRENLCHSRVIREVQTRIPRCFL